MAVSGGKIYVVPLTLRGCEVAFVVFTNWDNGWQIRRVSICATSALFSGPVLGLQVEYTYHDRSAALQFAEVIIGPEITRIVG
jgi:hypothetical protein